MRFGTRLAGDSSDGISACRDSLNSGLMSGGGIMGDRAERRAGNIVLFLISSIVQFNMAVYELDKSCICIVK